MQQQGNTKSNNGVSTQKEYMQYSQQLFSNAHLPSIVNPAQPNNYLLQQIPQQVSNKPKCNRRKVNLSQEQTEALVLSWREKGFGDFNNWIQSAKAEQNIDFIENPLEVGVRTFTCKLEIYFPNYSNVPSFSSVGTGRSKKEAKKIAQERILLDIIKDGYLNLGYKDDNFLDKIPRLSDVHQMIIQNTKTGRPDLKLVDQQQLDTTAISQAYSLDIQNRQILQGKQIPPTQNEINAFYQDLSLSGIDKINTKQSPLTNTPISSNTLTISQPGSSHIAFYPNDKSTTTKEKDELQKKIFKLSKQMQENLKQDKYFEACQVLVQILSKKSPEWNEINHIWSYALLSKDIVYVKVLIDLIIQKTITKPKEGEQSSQKKEDGNLNGLQKQEDESVEQAKKELMKIYGNNIQRVETDNVYDYFDSYTLMMNRPEIDNQTVQNNKVQVDLDEQQCLLTDISQTHLQQEIEAQISHQQPINEVIAPFDSQIKSLEKREVLKEIDNLKKQISYYQSLQNLDQNANLIKENNNQDMQNSIKFIQQKLNSQENDAIQDGQNNKQDIISGEFPSKKIKLNEEETKEQQYPQENQLAQINQEPQKIQEFSQKIEELQQLVKKKEKEVLEIDKQYEEYLKLQEQRKKQLEDQQEQQRQYELQLIQQRNNKMTTPLNSYYIPQQQQQPGYQSYQPYMNQQQQQSFQYPTMAYNHYDYSMQNSAIFQQSQYYSQYYYNQHQGYPYNMQYPTQYANSSNVPYSTPQYPPNTYYNYSQQQPSNQQQQQQQPLVQDQKVSQEISQLNPSNKNESLTDQTTIIEKIYSQAQNINYLKYNLVDEMYDSLLYLGDMNFSLAVAEQIYSKVKINVSEFQNIQAAHYYSNKKNMLVVELIEYIFQVFNSSKPRLNEAFASINGQIEKIGNKFSQEVLLFKPASTEINLEQKIAKKGLLEQRENYSLIAEGEFVMLTSLYQSNNNDHGNLYSDLRSAQSKQYLIQFLNNIASSLNIQPPDVRAFYNKISENGQPIEFAMIGYVREISKESAIKLFILPTPQQSRAVSDSYRIWKITKLVNKTTYDRTCEALLKFVSTKSVSEPIMNIILTPPLCDKQKIQEMSEKIVFTPSKNTLFNPTLNHSQQTALQFATTRALTLIQGPPGTGKTTTAVHIVQEWCRQSSDPVLACADSNIAVDILHKEFIKSGIRACRIGPGSESKNELMQDPKYRTYIESFKKQQQGKNPISAKFMFMKKLISESQVVCATNVGSMSEYLKEQNFTRVIIDEATQATEMSTIIPLINKAQQVVLIGDHKQLPPTVLSSLAQSKGMTISLFERLVKQGIQPKMLMRQYRMHSTIALFPSHQFYNNLLENGVSDQQRLPIEGFIWPNKLLRVAFININGEERVCQSSVLNYQEVQVVTEIIVDVLKTKKTSLQQIGVITPYDAQKRRIKNEISNLQRINPQVFGQNYQNDFKQNKYQNNTIEVDTIDGYQGMEKDLIIISTVRSNNKCSIGFLKDPRRMNVALTRAKRGLIIVGNLNTLQKDSNWRDFITWVNANKAVIQYGVNNIAQNMNKMALSNNQS
ncbi:AAA domain protein (macronuclear) [Tetrahymena thermophila SB210]|uniref:AAA domain protein n=1 Tax=Tetrahymena thermophila (strain SB210) TaxID=312017 RepID=Q24HZ6_TETTS|nr:AAA domain protein [Tetrahymena thermophila SB210]EAS07442.2 AAA domain protein [Tetrahymena thermophila SB210]|eukprot:XP_001027684.2 AAA domain protein [Tetrahymena thermophila SB210]